MLKRFLLNALSSFVGAWIAITLAGFAAVMLVIAMIGSAAVSSLNTGESVKKHSVLRISLDGTIEEAERATTPDPVQLVRGDVAKPQTLNVIVESIREAARNKNIDAIYLDCGAVAASTATLNAIRQELLEFRKSGKPVYAYGDAMTLGSYFVASAANRIYANPEGEIMMQGMASTTMFMKDLFDKVGIRFQVVKVGTYKSAVEPYILNDMSEPARAQMDTLLGNMWKYIRQGIASQRRGVTASGIDTLVSVRNISFAPMSEAVRAGLIDSLAYGRTMNVKFAALTGRDEDDVNYVSPSTLVSQTPWGQAYGSKNQIAVLYACGEIVDGDPRAIDYRTLVPVIVGLADDEDVKGMVLRVNSPGGSAFGSAQIGEALDYFQSKGKPLAVSMGDYAASGGYWISACADMIFTDALTITGSIGIFGLIPDVSELAAKAGVHPVTVSTNPGAQFPTLLNAMDERQLAVMQAYVDRGYESFVGRVAKGRRMSVDAVKRIAEGRVWDAMSARRIGLVDSIGNLRKAVEWTARKADVYSKYEVSVYPQYEPGLWDMLTQGTQVRETVEKIVAPRPEEAFVEYVRTVLDNQRVQARMAPVRFYLN